MTDPRILSLFMIIFILLGTYNVFSGLRKQREARARGQSIAWYRQINLLTGLEYLLLSFVFIINLNFRSLPNNLKGIAIPFYLLVILLSAVVAGFVIRQAIINARSLNKNRSSQAMRGTSRVNEAAEDELAPVKRAASMQRKSSRRQKAAAARRRRAGKA